MGDRLRAGIPSRYVTSQLDQLSLASLRGRLIEYQFWLGLGRECHLCRVAGSTVGSLNRVPALAGVEAPNNVTSAAFCYLLYTTPESHTEISAVHYHKPVLVVVVVFALSALTLVWLLSGLQYPSIAAPHAWNSLPDANRRSPSLATFKRSLKTYFFMSSGFINIVYGYL